MDAVCFEKTVNIPSRDKQLPLSQTPFEQLPLGDIKCSEGWLCEQLKLMSRGITGRLPEYGPYFRPERNGFLYPETRAGWEEVPLWLRGFYPLAVLLDDEAMLKTADQYIQAIFQSQQEDGWFGPAYLKDGSETPDGRPVPDLFPNMILTDTLILYYTHTRDNRVLSLLEGFVRFCLSLSDEQFLPPIEKGKLRWQKIRAGDLLEPLYWYFRQTGDAAALTLAERVHRAIAKSVCGFIATHAVDFAQRFAYDAIYSQQSGNKEDFDRSESEYEKFAAVWGQTPRGIFAADEKIRPGAVDPREAYEPCGMVELAKNFYTLGRISGCTRYADRAEDIMLNHFAPSFTPDYQQVHYLTSANGPVLSNYTCAATHNGTQSHDRSYQIMTPNNRCCGHNTGMGWPWYVMNLWQKTADGGLAAFLYAPCQVDTTVDGRQIRLSVQTDYPFRESVQIKVDFDGTLPLRLRIPAWCKSARCTVNEAPVWCEDDRGGWLHIRREWKRGDVICLTLPMELSLTRWPNTSVSVDRGPLTYSVRIKEQYRVVEDALAYRHPQPHLWENYEILPASPWNYGLVLEDGDIANCVRVSSLAQMVENQPFTEPAAPIVLQAKAKKIPRWQLQDSCAAELQKGPIYSSEPEEVIEMIPLGCARLRMACLPVVTDDPNAARWVQAPEHVPCDQRPKPFAADYDFTRADSAPWKPADE